MLNLGQENGGRSRFGLARSNLNIEVGGVQHDGVLGEGVTQNEFELVLALNEQRGSLVEVLLQARIC